MEKRTWSLLLIAFVFILTILTACSTENSQEYRNQVSNYLNESGNHSKKITSLIYEDNFGTTSYKVSHKNEILRLNKEYNEFIASIEFNPKSKTDKKEQQYINQLIENDLKIGSSLDEYVISGDESLYEDFQGFIRENVDILNKIYN